MIQNKKKQHNGFSEFVSTVILPCKTELGELWNEFWRNVVNELLNQSAILSSGQDIVPVSKRRGVVCEIPCRECERKYIGQTKPEHSIERIPGTLCQKYL